MKRRPDFLRWSSLGLLALFAIGCGHSEPASFRLNFVQMQRRGILPEQQEQPEEKKRQRDNIEDMAVILEAMFGTPDNPVVLRETGLDKNKIYRAAGPVGFDSDGVERGLFRRHCVHCHGISGDGAGPTAAFLSPYPRDYRPGIFKFKSTERVAKPSTEDLHRVLFDGVPGTAMPSFKLLAADELDALIEYVKYLTLRGEMENQLINAVVDLSGSDHLSKDRSVLIGEMLTPLAEQWSSAAVVPVPAPPQVSMDESIAMGRDIFFSKKVECIKCHGLDALGDGGQINYDDWNKDFKDYTPAQEAEKIALGGLPTRTITPRNLRQGTYRGGRRPVDLYRRIYSGVNGTPMPEAPRANFTSDEIWHLVHYIKSLPFEAISQYQEDRFVPQRVQPN